MGKKLNAVHHGAEGVLRGGKAVFPLCCGVRNPQTRSPASGSGKGITTGRRMQIFFAGYLRILRQGLGCGQLRGRRSVRGNC